MGRSATGTACASCKAERGSRKRYSCIRPACSAHLLVCQPPLLQRFSGKRAVGRRFHSPQERWRPVCCWAVCCCCCAACSLLLCCTANFQRRRNLFSLLRHRRVCCRWAGGQRRQLQGLGQVQSLPLIWLVCCGWWWRCVCALRAGLARKVGSGRRASRELCSGLATEHTRSKHMSCKKICRRGSGGSACSGPLLVRRQALARVAGGACHTQCRDVNMAHYFDVDVV